jgi:ectoine hydroxylase-related dioxygenase (phytanoyl-CoA dioxygenase family)
MPKVLTDSQVTRYHEQGYLAPVDVMSEAQADELKMRLQEAEAKYPQDLNAQNRNNPHLTFKFMDEIAHHSTILDAVEDLIGQNFSLWGSVLFIKEPQSSGYVSWHQDATYMGLEPQDFVTPWLALTHSNLTNGCMSMIPGSHRNDIRHHEDTFDEDNILTRGQAISDVDESCAVDLILKPGQMSLHHARIIHGSKPNLSNKRRIGAVLQCFATTNTLQVQGENHWMPIRGSETNEQHVHLPRPVSDMDAAACAARELANRNWSKILYQGAKTKRAY